MIALPFLVFREELKALAIYGAQSELNAPDLLGDIARVAKNTAKQCEQMVMILESEGADKLH